MSSANDLNDQALLVEIPDDIWAKISMSQKYRHLDEKRASRGAPRSTPSGGSTGDPPAITPRSTARSAARGAAKGASGDIPQKKIFWSPERA